MSLEVPEGVEGHDELEDLFIEIIAQKFPN